MSIEIQGIEAIQKSLDALSKTLGKREMKSTMSTIGGMVKNVIEDSFEQERSPWGEKWKALNPKTTKQKQKKNKSNLILRNSGSLADRWSVTATSSSVEVSGNAKSNKGYAYGAVHQWGSKKVAARKFLPIKENGDLEEKLKGNIEKYLANKVDEALK